MARDSKFRPSNLSGVAALFRARVTLVAKRLPCATVAGFHASDVSPQQLDETDQLPFSSASNRALLVIIAKMIWSGPCGYSLSRIDRAHAWIGR